VQTWDRKRRRRKKNKICISKYCDDKDDGNEPTDKMETRPKQKRTGERTPILRRRRLRTLISLKYSAEDKLKRERKAMAEESFMVNSLRLVRFQNDFVLVVCEMFLMYCRTKNEENEHDS
jgi:hypothetical protein